MVDPTVSEINNKRGIIVLSGSFIAPNPLLLLFNFFNFNNFTFKCAGINVSLFFLISFVSWILGSNVESRPKIGHSPWRLN